MNMTNFTIVFMPKRKMNQDEMIEALDKFLRFAFQKRPVFEIDFLRTKKINIEAYIYNLRYDYGRFSLAENFKILSKLFALEKFKTKDFEIELFAERGKLSKI